MFFCLNVTRDREVDLADQQRTHAEFLRTVLPSGAPWEADQG
ncbi:MAG: hypothetical protein GEU86_18445 [Actinophytocola sp.]|nr:hypothetical protein [Actinophytocola sp.]